MGFNRNRQSGKLNFRELFISQRGFVYNHRLVELKKTELWFCGGFGPGEGVSRLYDKTIEADRYCARGNKHSQRGNADMAQACYRKAAAIDPQHALAYKNIGDALYQKGEYEKAEAHLKIAMALNPSLFDVLNSLGCAVYAQGRLWDAEGFFRQSIVLNGNSSEAHCCLGAILMAQGRLAKSVISLRRALELEPNYPDAWCHLGGAFTQLSKLDEAEACFQKALEINPDHTDALVGVGNAFCHKGQFRQGEAIFQRALSIDPGKVSALSALVGVRKMLPENADWLIAVNEMVKRGLPFYQESCLRFAMGKYFDGLNDFDQAFQNYNRANDLIKLRKYDRCKRETYVDNLIRRYDAEQIRQIKDGACDSELPVFVFGMMRSGTSLTEQIIASHPEAFGAGELNFWNVAIAQHETRELISREREKLHQLASDYLRTLARFSGKAIRVVDKTPLNFENLGLIHSVFPNARFIHLQRNPIDTCLSIYFQSLSPAFDFANDLSDLAHYYREYHRLMAHWRKVLPSDVFFDLPYEALIADKETWTRKLIEFIGLDWNERCLDFHETERRVGTASNWQVRQKIYESSVARWRNYQKYLSPLLGLSELK